MYFLYFPIVYPDLTAMKGFGVKLADTMQSLEEKHNTAMKTQ